MTDTLSSLTMSSPIGPLRLTASDTGLCSLEFHADSKQIKSQARSADRTSREPAKRHPIASQGGRAGDILKAAQRQLTEYFAGKRQTFDLPLDIRIGTPFQRTAWLALQQIPYGQTFSYAKQAKAMKNPKACRAVGGANGKNPLAIIIPCHRVIGADGSLTGFGGGLPTKQKLLALEQRIAAARLAKAA